MSKFPFPSLYNGTGPGASDITDKFATTESPKLKFNFFVTFSFRSDGEEVQSIRAEGGRDLVTNQLPVKHATRINPTIEYTDVNFYGYRSKVATKTEYGDVTFTFYDDSSNRVHTIIDTYMEAVSPLVSTPSGNKSALEERQTIGALRNSSELGIINYIELLHEGVGSSTKYTYFNPKIKNIVADDLDMTISEVATIAMTFTYDTYRVDKIRPSRTSVDGGSRLPDADDFDSGLDSGLPGAGGPQGPILS